MLKVYAWMTVFTYVGLEMSPALELCNLESVCGDIEDPLVGCWYLADGSMEQFNSEMEEDLAREFDKLPAWPMGFVKPRGSRLIWCCW